MTRVSTGVWAVFRNSDLTEGRGHSVEVGRFSSEDLARQVARGIDTMGADGSVRELERPDIPVFDNLEDWMRWEHGDQYARGCHVRAIDQRVRKLEDEIDRLLELKETIDA